jgi:hypothetical protein
LPTRPCEGCAMGKNKRRHFPKIRSSPRAEKAGIFLHVDVCRPMHQESFDKSRYFVLFKDDYSGYCIVYCIRNKFDVFERFKGLCALVIQQIGNCVQKIHSDRGGEFMGTEFIQFLASSGIRHELTNPHTLEQNGSAERENRTLMECVYTMIHSKNLNLALWREAIQTATYLLNRIGSRTHSHKTPYELWFGDIPSVDHLQVFGCNAYAHIPKANRRKLDPKSIKTIFMGYCIETKGYRLWNAKKCRMIVCRDIIFDELSSLSEVTPDTFSSVFSFQPTPALFSS